MTHDDAYYFNVIRYNIKRIRESKNLTQQQLADKANITMNYLSKIESTKMQRGLSIVILGRLADALEVDIIQMVRLVENGEEVKMSKRTGNAVTIRELCDDVGVDAARYFFLSKALDTQFDFDLGLARSQSNDNPVYYVQYAYARICSILKNAPDFNRQEVYTLLNHEKESDLLKHINEFSDTVSDCAINRSPNKLCNYAQKLATYFHSFYGNCKVIDDSNKELMNERLCLLEATRITLKNTLNLLGIDAPEKM